MSRYINKITISIIGFYAFWLGLLPFALSNGISAFCQNFSHNSNYEIELEKPKITLSLLPKAYFSTNKILVKSKAENADLLIDNLKFELRLLPLLSGRLHINDIEIDDLELKHSLKKHIELDKNFFKNLTENKIICDEVQIKHLKFLLFQQATNMPISYEAVNLSYQHKNRYSKFYINSSLDLGGNISTADINLFLPSNNDIKKTVFDIDISNLNLAPFRVNFKNYLPEDLVELNGLINIKANKDELVAELNNCAIIMKDYAQSIIFPKKMSIKSKFNIKHQVINLDYVDILSENIDASIKGTIADYMGKSMPTLNLNITVNKSRIEDFIAMLPAFKIEEIDTYKLKKYGFKADTLANFSIKGRLPEPEINGDIFINNGVLIKPISNTTKGATIKLEFLGKYLNFDALIPTGISEKVSVKGGQELYNIKYADFEVKSSENVDLTVLKTVLSPIHEILNFIIGPVPIMDFSGKGNIDITVKGNRKTPHVWGKMNFKNATIKFIDLPNMVLQNSDAVLTFKDQDALFTNRSGFVNNRIFKINGICNLYGKFDFDIFTQNQPANDLYNAIKTSKLVPQIKEMLPDLEKISGLIDLNLKIYGDVKKLDELNFNSNYFTKGEIVLKDNSYTIQNIDLTKTNGIININAESINADIKSNIGDLPLTAIAKIKNDFADIYVDIPKLNPNFLLRDNRIRKKQYLPYISLKAKYKGLLNTIEYEKMFINAKILSSNPDSILKFNSGEISLVNNKLNLKNIKGYFSNPKNEFIIDLKSDDAFSKEPLFNGTVNINTPDISLMNDLIFLDILPENFLKFIKNYELKKGALNLKCRVFNNHVNASTDIGGISLIYLPNELPIEIINGSLIIRNNILKLNKINILADEMPILADGEIRDIFDKQIFNIYFNTKPQQEFIDKYINKNQIYPIKIKGDIVAWIKIKGTKDNYDLKSEIDMSKNSSIYHYGATIGDLENAIKVAMDSRVVDSNNFKIREFSYDKLIESQNGKQTKLNLVKTSGGVEIFEDDLEFKDLRIKTSNPTDARIFNIIFRKPNIKEGLFTSDLKLNGKLSSPKIIGDFHIFETDIPFFDTSMKNIILVFKDKTINISSKGEVLGNDITFKGVLKNNLTQPYQIETADLYTKNLDLNRIINKFKISEVEENSATDAIESINLSNIIAKNFRLKADSIILRNIQATDFEATTSLNNKGEFEVNNFKFNIAQGTLNGKYKYNLQTDDQSVSLSANSINANDIALALFNLDNQIYGDMTGTVQMSCNGESFQNCMETLGGIGEFSVKDGRMPKLGSLEYLLKAGNLVKGGLTGLSINSVIDIVTPLKTGDFEMISGNFRIKDGMTRQLEIASKGDDLSLYITGNYNFATSIADMQVFGLLSKKISTFLGPIGNMSINTLFNVIPGIDLSKDSLVLEKINKVPGIELSSKAFRRFIADIKGNINGEDYVTSFKWIN